MGSPGYFSSPTALQPMHRRGPTLRRFSAGISCVIDLAPRAAHLKFDRTAFLTRACPPPLPPPPPARTQQHPLACAAFALALFPAPYRANPAPSTERHPAIFRARGKRVKHTHSTHQREKENSMCGAGSDSQAGLLPVWRGRREQKPRAAVIPCMLVGGNHPTYSGQAPVFCIFFFLSFPAISLKLTAPAVGVALLFRAVCQHSMKD
ncbi:hypothetical protein MAPG_02296 [Magnaporthiopsis poae ATCC 64411]|uniref:Uncharacterized protein n=1 Tax=Magnaporthiopsis poae (strain ATCC 64411 / 73-15) TaxID=644358 RepID=A0A0C4DQZ7_MAGP6|nr:hypothetical protein MAPG_02296 [Magnaporthiopsis poae ATCC 64411]